MSKKKKQASPGEVYAMCVTIGLILGVGLGPVLGNVALTALTGCVAGAAVAFFLVRNNRQAHRKSPH